MVAYQYLVSDKTAAATSNAIAVTLTLALPRLYILIKRSVPHLVKFYKRNAHFLTLYLSLDPLKDLVYKVRRFIGPTTPTVTTEDTLLEMGRIESSAVQEQHRRIFTGFQQTLQESLNSEDAVSQLAQRHLAMARLTVDNVSLHGVRRIIDNFAEDPKAFALISACMLLFFAICLGLQVVAISSTFIIGDSAALVKEGRCAYSISRKDDYWNAGYERPNSRHGVYGDLTEEALKYAESCYSGRLSVAECRGVLTQTLPYNITSNSTCPFPAKDMCSLGENSGYSLDTGFLDSKILGFNTRINFQLRRRTTCAPIVQNSTFLTISNISMDEVKIRYLYDYRGPRVQERYMTWWEPKMWNKQKAYFWQNYRVE